MHLGRDPDWLARARSKRMLEALKRGTTLVVDRFAPSGAAFTAAKGVPGLNLDWCKVRPCSPLDSAGCSAMTGCGQRWLVHGLGPRQLK